MEDGQLEKLRNCIHSSCEYFHVIHKLIEAELAREADYQLAFESVNIELMEYAAEIASFFGEDIPHNVSCVASLVINDQANFRKTVNFIQSIFENAKIEVDRKWKSVVN